MFFFLQTPTPNKHPPPTNPHLNKPTPQQTHTPQQHPNLTPTHVACHVADHPATIDIVSGIATCLAKNTTGGRRLNEIEKHFYSILLNSQSPWAEKFVSHKLMGPHIRTIKRLRSERSIDIAMEGCGRVGPLT